jgi:ATP-dependent DNA helicase RecQ
MKLKTQNQSGCKFPFETLRKLRYDISKEEEVPAYVIFSDAALRQMETNRPMSEDELLAIDGVGKVKLEKYGKPL